MKLVSLQCPHCNARLDVNQQFRTAVCNYCGCQFQLDDESRHIDIDNMRRAGYEFERGRMEAQNHGCDPVVLNKIRTLLESYDQLVALRANKEALEKEMAGKNREYDSLSRRSSVIAKYLIPGFFLLGALSCFTQGVDGIISGLIMVAIAVTVYFVSDNKAKKNISSLGNYLTSLSDDYVKTCSELNMILQKCDIRVVPPNYLDKNSLLWIYNALFSNRARSVAEAINGLETERYRNAVLNNQRQQLLNQQQEMSRLYAELDQIKTNNKGGANKPSLSDLAAAGSVVAATVAIIKKISK